MFRLGCFLLCGFFATHHIARIVEGVGVDAESLKVYFRSVVRSLDTSNSRRICKSSTTTTHNPVVQTNVAIEEGDSPEMSGEEFNSVSSSYSYSCRNQ
jgi:hypothetical protein